MVCHSEIGITADTYGHLEFNSKLESAAALTWISETELSKAVKRNEEEQAVSEKNIPDLMQALLDAGVPADILQTALQKNNQPVPSKQAG